jgi:hypothetical protein
MAFHVVTGIGPDGRSTVLSKEPRVVRSPREAGFDADDADIRPDNKGADLLVAKLYEADPEPRVARTNKGHLLPVPFPPGAINWIEMKYDGQFATELHRTDSIDLHYILSGATELVLENGSIHLSAGDTVVVPGVVHAWRSANGWASNIFAVGLKPLS